MGEREFEVHASGCAPWLYPTDTIYGLLWYNDTEALEIPKKIPFCGEWGNALSTSITIRENYPIPYKLNIAWISLVENKIYEADVLLPKSEMERKWALASNMFLFSHIVVGMAPYGKIAIWNYGDRKSLLIRWTTGKDTKFNIKGLIQCDDIESYCKTLIKNSLAEKNWERNGLPPRNLYDKYMQQFVYRYLPIYEQYDANKKEWQKYKEDEQTPEFEYIEEALFDGTHDKLHDDGLLKYHEAGKPKKLAVKWHIKKSEYTAYFWFEDEKICAIYDKFYGAHPDTKTDFIIRIDAEKKKYELALFRYGLKEPQMIPESTYQLLVFKNGFEDYRSDNYSQARGAWIW